MTGPGNAGAPQTSTIGALLSARASLSGKRLALVGENERVTFTELDRRASKAARALADLGVTKGDRVGLLLPNGIEYCVLFYALARIGAVCCGLNHRLAPNEIAVIIADSGLRLLIADETFANLAQASLADAELVTREGVRLLALASADGDDDFRRRAMAAPSDALPETVAPGDPLLLVYTSGTTGLPKGVMISHEQMFWTSLTIGFSLDYRFGDVHLLPVPMFHVGGLSFTVHFVHAGATAVIPARWRAGAILDLIEGERVNHFFAVPTMLVDLADDPGFTPERLASVRWIMAGGAPVPPALIKRYAGYGIPVVQTYGATETCGPGFVVDADHAIKKAGSVGKPFFHTRCRLVGSDGSEPAPGAPGEIELSGAHIASGYWGNPQASAESFRDGWFRTGDVGYRDGDGYLFILDRMKNKILSGGENVYPAEVEAVLESHPAIREAAVIGAPHPRWGEIVCAIVVPQPGQTVTLDEIAAYCEGRLARYKIPRRLHLTEALARNATGKLLRQAITAEWAFDSG